jgi:hypothetical protein
MYRDALRIPSPSHVRSDSVSSYVSATTVRSAWSTASIPTSPESEIIPRTETSERSTAQRGLLQSHDDSPGEPPDNPFAFTAEELGEALYDEKDLAFLKNTGGVKGLVLGLRTDLHNGLLSNEDQIQGHMTKRELLQSIQMPAPRVSISIQSSSTSSEVAGKLPQKKRFTDRRRIFGENRIPVRPPKNIFQLMWIALHDKVIVTPYILC